MNTFTLISIMAAAGFAAALAQAEPPPVETSRDVRVIFESLDRDDDARVSRNEARTRSELRRRFAGVDANQDGYLTLAEFSARPSAERFE